MVSKGPHGVCTVGVVGCDGDGLVRCGVMSGGSIAVHWSMRLGCGEWLLKNERFGPELPCEWWSLSFA